MRLRLAAVLAVLAMAGVTAWLFSSQVVDHWLAVHTGTVNEPGPYYGFWSGFGSDAAEFGVLGAAATTGYQLARKHNCHETGCWRVGNHPAAGGEFQLCYRHHPDYHGVRPGTDVIHRLHREHRQRETAAASRLPDVHEHSAGKSTTAGRLGREDPLPAPDQSRRPGLETGAPVTPDHSHG